MVGLLLFISSNNIPLPNDSRCIISFLCGYGLGMLLSGKPQKKHPGDLPPMVPDLPHPHPTTLKMSKLALITLPLVRVQSNVISVSICLHISQTTLNFTNYSACYLCPWLGPPQCIAHFSFLWMMSCFHIIQRMGQNQRQSVRFVQFAMWQHRGKVCSF